MSEDGGYKKPCCVPDCDLEVTRAGMCWSHARRFYGTATETPRVRGYYRSCTMERLTVAALEYAFASDSDDEAFRRARERLRKAAMRYATQRN